ncbi:MAG: alpha/beta hydrolase fold domain-containing protein [Candidatus Rariloculaceae bacterium]
MKSVIATLTLFVSLLTLPLGASAQGQFLRSANDLADPRGYCLDIPGFGPRMQLDGPIGTHSCKYSLPGFDVDEILELADGKLMLSNYDRCLAADAMESGSDIRPVECNDAHGWQVHSNGRVTPASSTNYCMSLAAERIFVNSGPGTVPPYSSRGVTLEACTAADAHLQSWRWSAPDERVTYNANSLRSGMPIAAREGNIEIGTSVDPRATGAIYGSIPHAFGSADVTASEDISYGPNERHLLRVYEGKNRNPPGGNGAPIIVLVHGGGFSNGNLNNLDHAATHFAGLGFVAVNITYPLAPDSTWPSGPESVAAAITWIHEHIEDYRGNAERIYLMGHSAGANHVANYVLRPGFSSGDTGIAGAIFASPALQLDPNGPAGNSNAYFDADSTPWSDIRLLDNVEAAPVPILITVAQFDPDTFHQSTAELYGRLIGEFGARPRLRQIPGHGHISYIQAIGTDDHLFVEEALDFMLEDW